MPELANITINAFIGMNNVKSKERLFVAEGVAEPTLILNADTTETGTLEVREGYTLKTELTGAHSLWAGTDCLLCVAKGVLYLIEQWRAIPVCTISGPEKSISYAEVNKQVYMSNMFWQGIYDMQTKTVKSWGISLPTGPSLLTTAGSLSPGVYHVCFTTYANGEISGNGPITSIELVETGGIQILNRPTDAITWITDTNEAIFYPVGLESTIVKAPESAEPLPSFLCSPPPFLENICYHFGRIWGNIDNTLYYSEPYNVNWFKVNLSRFAFDSGITLIAKVPTGLFIGTEQKTWFLEGTEPQKMFQREAGAGSIEGTLAYCNNLPELGDILGTPEKGYVDVPVWRTKEGIVAGNSSGRLFNLSRGKISMSTPAKGASLFYKNSAGLFKFLTSAVHDGSIEVLNELGISELYRTDLDGAVALDTVDCEVRRGGILI